MICNAAIYCICNEAYKSVSSPEVFSTDLDPRLGHDDSRHELVAVADLLVAVVCDSQLHTRCEVVHNFSDYSSYGERIDVPRHLQGFFDEGG